jgi:hypothetical protein
MPTRSKALLGNTGTRTLTHVGTADRFATLSTPLLPWLNLTRVNEAMYTINVETSRSRSARNNLKRLQRRPASLTHTWRRRWEPHLMTRQLKQDSGKNNRKKLSRRSLSRRAEAIRRVLNHQRRKPTLIPTLATTLLDMVVDEIERRSPRVRLKAMDLIVKTIQTRNPVYEERRVVSAEAGFALGVTLLGIFSSYVGCSRSF